MIILMKILILKHYTYIRINGSKDIIASRRMDSKRYRKSDDKIVKMDSCLRRNDILKEE